MIRSALSVTSGAENKTDEETVPRGGKAVEDSTAVVGETRGARALGDIGNRLRKHLTTGPGGGPVLLGKEKTTTTMLKPSMMSLKAGPLKATENLPLLPLKPPRAKGLTLGGGAKKENVKPPTLAKSSSSTSLSSLMAATSRALLTSNASTKVKVKVESQVEKVKTAAPTTITTTTKTTTIIKTEEVKKEEIKVEDFAPPALIEDIKEAKLEAYSNGRFAIEDIDAVDGQNQLLVTDYVVDICDYLFKLEKKYPIKIGYLEGRLVNSKMRALLLDWLVEVHFQFGFVPETLYLAAKTLDRYLQKERKVTRKQLQLVGVTALYIAAKFEEVCTPTVVDFSAVSDHAFSSAEVRQMERDMLQLLDFDLSPPHAVFFLRRFSKAAGVSDGRAPLLLHTLAKYIMELTIVDYATSHLYPSEQAAASLALGMLILDKSKTLKDRWTPTLQHYTKMDFEAIKRAVGSVATVLGKIHSEPLKLKAVYTKYGRNRLCKVSLSPELNVKEWQDRVSREISLQTPPHLTIATVKPTKVTP